MKNQTTLLISSLAFCLICTMATLIMGSIQEKEFKDDQDKYELAISLSSESSKTAPLLLQEIIKKYPDNFSVNKALGFSYRTTQNYSESVNYYQKSMEIKPLMFSRGAFVLMYAEAALMNRDYDLASALFQMLKEDPQMEPLPPEYADRVKLDQIQLEKLKNNEPFDKGVR